MISHKPCDPSLNAPVQLFQSENDAGINVNSTSLSLPRAASSLDKRDVPTPKQTGKRQDTTTSPLRSILNSAAAFVHQITQTQPQTLIPPSHVDVERSDDGPSPTSVLDTLFAEVADNVNEPSDQPRRSHAGMIGFIPKSAILRFVREDWFVTKMGLRHPTTAGARQNHSPIR